MRAVPLHRLPNITEQTEDFSQLTSKRVKGISQSSNQSGEWIFLNTAISEASVQLNPKYGLLVIYEVLLLNAFVYFFPPYVRGFGGLPAVEESILTHTKCCFFLIFSSLWWNLIKWFAFCVFNCMCFYLLLLNIWKSLFSRASVDHSVTAFGFMVTEKYQQIKTSVRKKRTRTSSKHAHNTTL